MNKKKTNYSIQRRTKDGIHAKKNGSQILEKIFYSTHNRYLYIQKMNMRNDTIQRYPLSIT